MKKFYFSYIYPDGKIRHSNLLSMNTNSYSFNKLIDVLNSYNRYSIHITYVI